MNVNRDRPNLRLSQRLLFSNFTAASMNDVSLRANGKDLSNNDRRFNHRIKKQFYVLNARQNQVQPDVTRRLNR